jgi:hypothetical protein
MTIKLVGKDRTHSVLDSLDAFFTQTVYPYLTLDQTKAIHAHLAELASWSGFDCSVQIGTTPEFQSTKIIIEITPNATTPGVKQ